MNKCIALLVAVLAFMATSCSKSPHLAGGWKKGGFWNVGQSCQILQRGTELIFINEAGDKSGGVLVAKRSEVIALDWEGGLIGHLTNNGTRINWRNGNWWLKDK